MKNRKTQGFTLIELLIVIAIIGILAAVLIPNLLGARTRAYDTTAQSCAKQIATAEETMQIDTTKYAAKFADLNKGVYVDTVKGCVATGITALETAGSLDTKYEMTVVHAQGSRTFTISPDGITSIAKP